MTLAMPSMDKGYQTLLLRQHGTANCSDNGHIRRHGGGCDEGSASHHETNQAAAESNEQVGKGLHSGLNSIVTSTSLSVSTLMVSRKAESPEGEW
jgi:hypothetical protein